MTEGEFGYLTLGLIIPFLLGSIYLLVKQELGFKRRDLKREIKDDSQVITDELKGKIRDLESNVIALERKATSLEKRMP